jgi:hypothetical protein
MTLFSLEATMKKLRLEMEELRVESFQTVQAPREKGTVIGHYLTPQCSGDGGYTCDYSCGGQLGSCAATCETCSPTQVCGGCLPPPRVSDYYVDGICVAG